ncbi:MAG: DUF1349 domain-containing protein [Spirochaetota bacterium]
MDLQDLILEETFTVPHMDKRLSWFNQPEEWEIDSKEKLLIVKPNAKTDFWQKTHYGFSADNGHFLYCEVDGNFILETQVSFSFKHQYDQAGLMVRISPECWIKTSIEYEPKEENKLGVVVTNDGFSDWSTQNCPKEIESLAFRISRIQSDYLIQYRAGIKADWIQLRMTHLTDTNKVQCGLYALSPKDKGFIAKFHYLLICKSKVKLYNN